LPIVLTLFALSLAAAAHVVIAFGDFGALRAVRETQNSAVTQSEKTRSQFLFIVRQLRILANNGDTEAQPILRSLEKNGVRFSPSGESNVVQ
jgi:parvulin-like peptidyl-prolyl isomerase